MRVTVSWLIITYTGHGTVTMIKVVTQADVTIAILAKIPPNSNGKAYDVFSKMPNLIYFSFSIPVHLPTRLQLVVTVLNKPSLLTALTRHHENLGRDHSHIT
jgi:hypothetical protein